jgi:hypothetical protein
MVCDVQLSKQLETGRLFRQLESYFAISAAEDGKSNAFLLAKRNLAEINVAKNRQKERG